MIRKNLLPMFITLTVVMSCKDDNDGGRFNKNVDYLVFGSFYGMCGGESCVEIYAIQDGKLYEDKADKYPAGQGTPFVGDFVQRTDESYQLVKDIATRIPSDLLKESSVIGCPDCADGGGVFIGLDTPEGMRFWSIDNMKSNVPTYLHELVDEVHEKINLLR